jgi:hypothetical protein
LAEFYKLTVLVRSWQGISDGGGEGINRFKGANYGMAFGTKSISLVYQALGGEKTTVVS